MNVIVTDKRKTPYCIATNEKTIYCAIRRGINKENYTLYMHPNFIYWLTRFTVKYIRENQVKIVCPEEYILTFRDDLLTRLTKEQIEDIAQHDSRMTIISMFLLKGFARANDNILEVIVNQHTIDTTLSSIERR